MTEQKTILVVEDELPLIEALAEKLKNAGFNVLRARDGREGYNTAIESHPDLILMDIIMSGMDGITAMKRIREDEWGAKAKIIMLSNLSDSDYINEAAKYGVTDFLVKTDHRLEDIVRIVKEKFQ